MRIYLDACALSRLSDDADQPRVLIEASAVLRILRMVLEGSMHWSASVALYREASRNPNQEKRHDALALLSHAEDVLEPTDEVRLRAKALTALGYGAYDALHLAHAEADRVDVLLTTDDRFLKMAARGVGNPVVRVANPVIWVREWVEEVRDGSIGDG